ncbi:PREDICTED: lysozyme C [Nipponia nippon]|uniref:lysozyme C n=1 Tax=Nipponia nippon TaxID=128390 RepID=UPI0005118B82|nr:PREDICTED: lysozyme C [Nipponia nippon]
MLAFCLLPLAARGKVYERRELAAAMKHLGQNNFWGHSLGPFSSSAGHLPAVAAQLERGRRVKLRSKQEWESRTNSRWWCHGGGTPRAKHVRNTPCSALLSSDRRASLTGAQGAVSGGKGLGAWWVKTRTLRWQHPAAKSGSTALRRPSLASSSTPQPSSPWSYARRNDRRVGRMNKR